MDTKKTIEEENLEGLEVEISLPTIIPEEFEEGNSRPAVSPEEIEDSASIPDMLPEDEIPQIPRPEGISPYAQYLGGARGTCNVERWTCLQEIYLEKQWISNGVGWSRVISSFYFSRRKGHGSSYASNGPTTCWIEIAGNSTGVSAPGYNHTYIGEEDWKFVTNRTHDVQHNADGTKWCSFSAEWVQNGTQPYNSKTSGGLNLPTIAVAPSTPSSISVSSVYEVGVPLKITWSAASGATSYFLQLSPWNLTTKSWEPWKDYGNVGNVTKLEYTPVQEWLGGADRGAVKWRVKAVNAGGSSSYRESGVVEHYGVRAWNGSAWVWGKMRIWNGSSWVKVVPRCWNGSKWMYT